MARVLGPDFLALQVRDLTASAQFYAERLGLERAAHSPPNAIVFRTEPVPFALREPVVDLAASPRLGWGVALWFLTDDADQLHIALAAAGVPITQPLQDGPFGRQFTFADPDGYQITVHGRP